MRYCQAKEDSPGSEREQEGNRRGTSTMIGRIDYTYEISVRSDSGGERVVVCSERCAGAADPGEGPTSYEFKGGEAAAKIGDLFLDKPARPFRDVVRVGRLAVCCAHRRTSL